MKESPVPMPMPEIYHFCFFALRNLIVKMLLINNANNGYRPTSPLLESPAPNTKVSYTMLYAPFGIPFYFSWPLITASKLTAGGATFPSRLATT
jgi:hypothetical protein